MPATADAIKGGLSSTPQLDIVSLPNCIAVDHPNLSAVPPPQSSSSTDKHSEESDDANAPCGGTGTTTAASAAADSLAMTAYEASVVGSATVTLKLMERRMKRRLANPRQFEALLDVDRGLVVRYSLVRPMKGIPAAGVPADERRRLVAVAHNVPYGCPFRIVCEQRLSATGSAPTVVRADVDTPQSPFTVDVETLVTEEHWERLGSAFTHLARAVPGDWLHALKPCDCSKIRHATNSAEMRTMIKCFYTMFYHGLFVLPFSEERGDPPLLHLANMAGRYCIDLSGCAEGMEAKEEARDRLAKAKAVAAAATRKGAGKQQSPSAVEAKEGATTKKEKAPPKKPPHPSTLEEEAVPSHWRTTKKVKATRKDAVTAGASLPMGGGSAQPEGTDPLTPLAAPTATLSMAPPSSMIRWDKARKVRQSLGQFYLSVNTNGFKKNLDLCARYHREGKDAEKGGGSTWITPWHTAVMAAMQSSETNASPLRLYAFELWDDGDYTSTRDNNNTVPKGGRDARKRAAAAAAPPQSSSKTGKRLCALSFGFSLGSLFHDFTMSTLVKDDRGCGTVLTKVVGDLLQRCGYKLWYWGDKVAYMHAYDSKRNREKEEKEGGCQEGAQQVAAVSQRTCGYGGARIARSAFYDLWEQYRDVPPTPVGAPSQSLHSEGGGGGVPSDTTVLTNAASDVKFVVNTGDVIGDFIRNGHALVRPLPTGAAQ